MLALIVVTVIGRLLFTCRQADDPLGSAAGWMRVLVVGGVVAIALLLMPSIGFLSGACLAGFVTALAFGESRLVYSLGLTLAVAALVTFGAREGLSIPLP